MLLLPLVGGRILQRRFRRGTSASCIRVGFDTLLLRRWRIARGSIGLRLWGMDRVLQRSLITCMRIMRMRGRGWLSRAGR
jgi:hypothetical protein